MHSNQCSHNITNIVEAAVPQSKTGAARYNRRVLETVLQTVTASSARRKSDSTRWIQCPAERL